MWRIHSLVLMVLIAAGCAGTQSVRYYTLNMTPSGKALSRFDVTVDRLRLSDALLRRDIMIRKSATEIEYYAGEQWAASLEELIREKLEAEFGPGGQDAAGVTLTGRVMAFEQVDSQEGAQARAKIELRFARNGTGSSGEPGFAKTYEVTIDSQPAPNGVALALSSALESLAAQAAGDMESRLGPH